MHPQCRNQVRGKRLNADAVQCEQPPHAHRRPIRIAQQPRYVSESEHLREMEQGACALLPADHDEVVLQAVQPGEEHHTGLVEPGRRLEEVA